METAHAVLGPVEFTHLDDAWLAARCDAREAFIGESLAAVKRQIERMIVRARQPTGERSVEIG